MLKKIFSILTLSLFSNLSHVHADKVGDTSCYGYCKNILWSRIDEMPRLLNACTTKPHAVEVEACLKVENDSLISAYRDCWCKCPKSGC